MLYTYEFYKKAADYILKKINFKPQIGIILGSALGSIAEEIENPTIIDYKNIPNFLTTTVESHAGKLILGKLAGKDVVCMSGRFHYYEGYDFESLTIPIRVFKLLGVETIILTNAAGGINRSFKPGDIMLIKDHIKLMGGSPVRGINIPEFGPRFFDVSDMYTKDLRKLTTSIANKLDIKIHEGVYYFAGGPQFETPSEIKAMRRLGGDAVGMSTVTEAITAAHCGMKVIGLSLISNMAAGMLNQPITTEEVDEAGKEASGRMKLLIREIVREI